jgi:hypothetical protein
MAPPRTPVGADGSIAVRRMGDRAIVETRIRDGRWTDGQHRLLPKSWVADQLCFLRRRPSHGC